MKAYDLIKEYIWLVNTIHKRKKISLEDINTLWRQTDMSGGLDYTRTTFKRHKNAIEDIFGLIIECDRSDNYKYYIENKHTLDEDTVQNWFLSTFSVNNIISDALPVQNRIQLEAIPDIRFVSDIIDAMKDSVKVEIRYRRFGNAESKVHIIEPYALKVYQRRWYLIAYFSARIGSDGLVHPSHYAIFSLDRIESVTLTDQKFEIDPDFSPKKYFRDCYGIVPADDTKAEEVVLRAYGREVYEMRSLPMHHSQRETNITDNYSDFTLHIKPTLDFAGKILSRGAWIEVMKPQSFRNLVIDMHKKSLERYNK